MTVFWHYTCSHGRILIGAEGVLVPPRSLMERVPRMPAWQRLALSLIWVTDLSTPERKGLGLTSNKIPCDRTLYRYRVTDSYPVDRWTDVRLDFPKKYRDGLESTEGAMPAHWFVSSTPLPVVFEPAAVA